MTVIAQGAEAVLERTQEGIRKSRPAKPYRHPMIDQELRTRRTRAEAKTLATARALGVPVPEVAIVDDHTLLLSVAPGVPLKETLDADPQLMHKVGTYVAKLHGGGVIHGDLTTSNIMHDPATGELTLIDFGLAYHSDRIEDRAVDLHVLKQALTSKHHRVSAIAFRHCCAGYRECAQADAVLERLRAVERRGRNKVT